MCIIDRSDTTGILISLANLVEFEEVGSAKKISRDESIKNVDRINLENSKIKGSISLEGGIIDDITFLDTDWASQLKEEWDIEDE